MLAPFRLGIMAIAAKVHLQSAIAPDLRESGEFFHLFLLHTDSLQYRLHREV
jgi:hypothetical protein